MRVTSQKLGRHRQKQPILKEKLASPDLVSIGGQSIPVSRKYKENVKSILAQE